MFLSFDILSLITDRTRRDVKELNEKGIYTNSDLNRVGLAMNYVASRLSEIGYNVNVNAKTNWLENEVPTIQSIEYYLEDLEKIRSSFNQMELTPETPNSMDNFSFEEANNIEKIISDVDFLINNISSFLFFSDDLYSGEV